MNKKQKIKQLRNKNGITLISLVVTIIVLIILVGVSISLVLGDNGIITKSKEGKQNTELAKIEEEVQLNEAVEYLENLGIGTTPTETKTVEEMKAIKDNYMTGKTTLKDSNGNLIVIPEGFKIAIDSGINVTEGIVIEDNDIIEGVGNDRGNQYIWIPVGEGIKKSDGTTVDITLGRYTFESDGTEILMQSAENYEEIVAISSYYQELATAREGVVSSGADGLNTTALDLKGFIDSVKANGGYYIARYEASYGTDGKANSKVSIGTPAISSDTTKTEGMLWNFITQIDAAVASRDLYKVGEKVTVNSDLMNSYAWDTAIVYIQAFSDDTDYSRQNSKNTGSNPANTGVNSDEVCKINDMASNTFEWTTEYSTRTYASPCIVRGDSYGSGSYCTSDRGGNYATSISKNYTFRYTLYM